MANVRRLMTREPCRVEQDAALARQPSTGDDRRPLPVRARQRPQELQESRPLTRERAQGCREFELAICGRLEERARVDRAECRAALSEDPRDEIAPGIRTAAQVRED